MKKQEADKIKMDIFKQAEADLKAEKLPEEEHKRRLLIIAKQLQL